MANFQVRFLFHAIRSAWVLLTSTNIVSACVIVFLEYGIVGLRAVRGSRNGF
jgi:hypothetical protein